MRWRTRTLMALAVVLVGVLAVPIALEYQFVRYLGPVWQGGNTLPLAVGMPLPAAYAVAIAASPTPTPVPALVGSAAPVVAGREPYPPRLPVTLVVALAAGHIAAFLSALRRYTVGAGGTIGSTCSPVGGSHR